MLVKLPICGFLVLIYKESFVWGMTWHVIQQGRPIQNSLYTLGNIEIFELQLLRQNYD